MDLEFRTLRAEDIDCRVGVCKENGVSLLLYKNARVDMTLLDETVGPMNWQRHHSRENANCTVSIYCEYRDEWIEKEDTGTESNTEAEKGLCSDSFKRACFNWGIGRELYTAPFIWIDHEKMGKSHREYNGKWYCNEKFTVQHITYDDQRRIDGLSIADSKGNLVFTFSSQAKKDAMKQKIEKKEDQKQVNKEEPKAVLCESCKNPIKGTVGKDGKTMSADEVVAFAMKKYKKCLCTECMKANNFVQEKL